MSRSVFVCNIPYDASEQQLIELFRTVGQVVKFKIVCDHETGNPKGFGFCEFTTPEAASSAIRNLNNHDFQGRPLRVDVADDNRAPGGRGGHKGGHGGAPAAASSAPQPTQADIVSKLVKSMNNEQLLEILGEMKKYTTHNPAGAKAMLLEHPEMAHTMLQILLMFGLVRTSDIQGLVVTAVQQQQQQQQQQQKQMQQQPPPVAQRPVAPVTAPPAAAAPGPTPDALANLAPDQQQLLRRLLLMPPAELALLPAQHQMQVRQLRQAMEAQRRAGGAPPPGYRR